MDHGLLPRAVRETIDDIGRGCGQAPTVELVGPGRWRLCVHNGRVRMTLDLAAVGKRHQIKWASSRLWVDGVERPTLDTADEFYRLFNGDQPTQAPSSPPQPLPAGNIREAPVTVQAAYRLMSARLTGSKPGSLRGDARTISVGRQGSLWAIRMEGPGVLFQMNLRQRRSSAYSPTNFRLFDLWIDGVDRSAEAEGSLEVALALLSTPRGEAAVPGAGVAGERGVAGVSEGVRVRRQAVIRT